MPQGGTYSSFLHVTSPAFHSGSCLENKNVSRRRVLFPKWFSWGGCRCSKTRAACCPWRGISKSLLVCKVHWAQEGCGTAMSCPAASPMGITHGSRRARGLQQQSSSGAQVTQACIPLPVIPPVGFGTILFHRVPVYCFASSSRGAAIY